MKLILGVAALLVTASVTYAADANPVRREMLKELIQLNKHLDSLDRKIDKLSMMKPAPMNTNRHVHRGADKVLLGRIKYPEKPTKENLKKYIEEIQSACAGQNSFSDRDPQTKMLKKVGHKNLDLLVDAYMDVARKVRSLQHGSSYLESAISQLVGPEDKELVIKMLSKNQNLINVVIKYGWEKDVKDILVQKVKYSQYLPTECIKIVAGYRDPKTYEALRSFFIKTHNPEQVLPYIKDLPIDIPSAVNEAWMAAKYSNHSWKLTQIAPVALEYGNVDAFEYMLNYIQEMEGNQHNLPKICFLLRKYSGMDGSYEEIREWVKKNRKQLYFDKKAKKFKVKAAKK